MNMDKKIKKLIDDNVFQSDKLDYKITQSKHSILNKGDVIIYVLIDHYKLWKNSGYYDPEYFELIYGLNEGYYDEEISDFLPLIGYDLDYFSIRYIGKNGLIDYSAYDSLFDAINQLGYSFEVKTYKEQPWLYVGISASDSDVAKLYVTLQNEFDLDVDDIILMSV